MKNKRLLRSLTALAAAALFALVSAAIVASPGYAGALSADRITSKKGLGSKAYPAAVAKIYAGSLVALNSSGYAAPAADTAGYKIAGVANAQADNSAGSAGDINVVVDAPVLAKFAATSITQAMVGQVMYVVDDQTFDDTTGTNGIIAGILMEFVSSTEGWIYINPQLLPNITATATELNFLDGVTAGTATASKAAVLGANKNLDALAIADGGLALGSGAGTAVTSTAAELNLVDAAPKTVTFAIAAGGATVAEVTITVTDAADATLAGIRNLEIWLSDAATGAGLTGTTASGTVQAKTSEGTDLTALTAKKHLIGQTKAAGTYILEITDTAKTGFYVAVKNPLTGVPVVSSQLQTADYGS